jgi:3-oxoacyl-[acyl-carrier-protein] synthase II
MPQNSTHVVVTGTGTVNCAGSTVEESWANVVAGGSEATAHLVGILTFDRLGAMSHRYGDPAGACKPFDKNRDGIVMGEGAAALIVEDLHFAQARGAKIPAEIVGYGATSEAFHVIAAAGHR